MADGNERGNMAQGATRDEAAFGAGATRREMAAALVVFVMLSTAYLGLAQLRGALGASRNDDWVYYRAAFDTQATGAITTDPFTSAMQVGQTILAQPVIALFGERLAALQAGTALVGAFGLWATYVTLRTFLSMRWAAFSTATLAIGPMYGTLATSFMTDVPAFTFQAIALICGVRALSAAGRATVAWFILAFLSSLLAVSIRETAVASGAAVILAAWLRFRQSALRRRWVMAVSASWGAACLGLVLWRRSTTPTNPDLLMVTGEGSAQRAALILLVLGLVVLPILPVFVTSLRGVFVLHRRVLLAAPLVALLVYAVAGVGLAGNYVGARGSYPALTVGAPPLVLPAPIPRLLGWCAVGALAAVLGVVGLWAAEARAGWASRKATVTMPVGAVVCGGYVVCLAVVALAVAGLTNGLVLDRYLFAAGPWVLGLALFLMRRQGVRPHGAVVLAGLAVWGALGLAVVDAAATRDGAKRALAETVADLGYAPDVIDGGYEWFGLHQTRPIHPPRQGTDLVAWWYGVVDDPRVCVVVRYRAGDPVPGQGSVPIAQITAQTWTGVTYDFVAVPTEPSCRSR